MTRKALVSMKKQVLIVSPKNYRYFCCCCCFPYQCFAHEHAASRLKNFNQCKFNFQMWRTLLLILFYCVEKVLLSFEILASLTVTSVVIVLVVQLPCVIWNSSRSKHGHFKKVSFALPSFHT